MKRGLFVRLTISLALVLSFVGVGCTAAPKVPGAFTDDMGRSVVIDAVPQRIVSLAPSNTEVLFALGLGDKVVGVDSFSDYPEAAKAIEKVGGFADTDIEKVVSLRPDLVVAANIHQKQIIPALEKLGIKVVGLDAKDLDGVLADVKLLGDITGESKRAGQLVDTLRKRIKAVSDKTKELSDLQRPRVLFVVWHDPIWAAGKQTLADDMIIKAGGVNIASGLTDYQTISLEKIVESDPQVIVAFGGDPSSMGGPFQWAK
ncbi:MAG TPA: ABC transporter substrate-binding protein, partial [Dehalococcoidia bacterium]|nr:ABC transporter substrate-binding protein [Dehalococcoidia bacterium]